MVSTKLIDKELYCDHNFVEKNGAKYAVCHDMDLSTDAMGLKFNPRGLSSDTEMVFMSINNLKGLIAG